MALEPQRVKEIFAAVSDAAPEQRIALLDRECAGDVELLQRVEALLKAHEDPASFLRARLSHDPEGTRACELSPQRSSKPPSRRSSMSGV